MDQLGIALVITDLEVGGAERCLADLATRLDRQRFLPVVYCLKPRPEAGQDSCVVQLEAGGIEVCFLNARGYRDAARAVFELARLLRRQRPALVQSMLHHANLVGRLAARRAGVRPVLAGVRVAERASRWHLWTDRWTSGLVDHYVCVSQAVARFVAQRVAVPESKLVVIPNGIDTSKYPASSLPPESLGISPSRRLVTFVGRLEVQKGVAWLLDASPQWLGQAADCDLLIVGKGPERPRLETIARGRGIADRVHFAGWRADIPQILASSVLVVLPSIWEGMPNVVLQAMATGLPVVSTDVEGVRELLGPDAASQTVVYGDSAALAARILAHLERPAEAAAVGSRNRLRAAGEFSVERMIAGYQDLWEKAIKCVETAARKPA